MRILIAAILSLSLFLLCNTPQEGEIDKKNSTERSILFSYNPYKVKEAFFQEYRLF